MQFLKSIKFLQDVVFDSHREDHKRNFKVKSRTYTRINHRKSTYDTNTHKRILFKEKVTDKTFIIFEKDLEINFKAGLNIIVGDNGCGKSSLLKQIFYKPFQEFYFSDKTEAELQAEHFKKYLKNDYRLLDFEKYPNFYLNGKQIHKNIFIEDLKNSKITLSGQDVLKMFDMYDSSNGENTLDFLNSLITLENVLILLDEPETSLSIKSQIKMAKILKKIALKNQIILVTHAPTLMQMSKEVYDFEIKKYIETETYIKNLYL